MPRFAPSASASPLPHGNLIKTQKKTCVRVWFVRAGALASAEAHSGRGLRMAPRGLRPSGVAATRSCVGPRVWILPGVEAA